MNNYNYIVTLFFISFFSFAQKQELGKVTIDELSQKRHITDTSAVAAVIFNRGTSYFDYSQAEGFRVITDVETKIKVFKKEGAGYGNFAVWYYKGSNSEESVNFSKAVTYNLENGVITKSKLKSENEYKERVTDSKSIKKIALPNVKEGSVIEYKYTIISPFITSLPEWSFQKEIPVAYSEYTTRIPQYFTYNKYLKGFLKLKETNNSSTKSLLINTKNVDRFQGYQSNTETVNFIETETTLTLANVPALKQEGYINNIGNYTTSVQYELAKKEFVGSVSELFATTWDAVSKKIYEDERFGAQLNKVNYFEDDLKTLLENASTDSQKTMLIFNYIKNRMSWDNTNSYYCDQGVKKAYQDKTGNAAEINLMLTAMLRYAKLNSNPILLSTRSNGIALYPSRTAYNYVISSVNLGDGNVVLLDATNKFSMPDLLPARDLNWFGRMITKEGATEDIDLSLKVVSNNEVKLFVKIDEKGEVVGKLREQYFDYNAFLFRDLYNAISKDNYLENLEKEQNGLEISNYERINENESGKPLTEVYDIKIKNAVELIGNKLYFSPLFHLVPTSNPFTQENREYPVDFTFPYQQKYLVIVQIPDGYVVESIPAEAAFSMDNDMGSFTYTINSVDNQIQTIIVSTINTAIVASADYQNLKLFYKNKIAKMNEKIVLKKI